MVLSKTFKERLVEITDQAQHFATLESVATGQHNDVSAAFREGLDTTERDSKDVQFGAMLAEVDRSQFSL